MKIGLCGFRQIKIDHIFHPVNIQPARSQVGRHQDPDPSVAVILQGGLPFRFVGAAVKPGGCHAVKNQLRDGFRNRRRRVHENQGAFRLNAGQQLSQHNHLVTGFRQKIHVGNAGRQRGIIPNRCMNRFTQPLRRGGQGFLGNRRRKQQQLTVFLRRLDDGGDRGAIRFIQQAVRFIQHNGFDRLGIDFPLLNQLEQPAGRTDEKVGLLFEFVDLPGNIHLADDRRGGDRNARILRQQFRLPENLHHQFVRRRQNDRLHFAFTGLDLLKQRQQIRQGFAGAGGRVANDIPALQDLGDHRRLDRGGNRDRGFRQACNQFFVKTNLFK